MMAHLLASRMTRLKNQFSLVVNTWQLTLTTVTHCHPTPSWWRDATARRSWRRQTFYGLSVIELCLYHLITKIRCCEWLHVPQRMFTYLLSWDHNFFELVTCPCARGYMPLVEWLRASLKVIYSLLINVLCMRLHVCLSVCAWNNKRLERKGWGVDIFVSNSWRS